MYIIVTKNEKLIDLAKRSGEFVFDVENLSTVNYSQPADYSNKTYDIDKLIVDTLLQLGVPAHVKGFNYLRYALTQLLTDTTFDENGLIKGVYANTAEHFKTTSQRVERCMREAVKLSADRGNIDLSKEIFGYSISAGKEMATNSEFIYGVKVYLQLKLPQI